MPFFITTPACSGEKSPRSASEKLPGSIYTVAAEVEALGGQALPLQVDVRDERQIADMAAQTAAKWGRIDILINNAGAMFWKPLLDTPAKRFDLMMAVNARAAFLCSQAVVKFVKLGDRAARLLRLG